MPLCITRIRWFKVIACVLGLMQLVGCATSRQTSAPVVDEQASAELAELFDDTTEPADVAAVAELPAETLSSVGVVEEAVDETAMVLPTLPKMINVYSWEVIGGGAIGNVITGVTDNRFRRPVAVAARGSLVYVVDAGQDAVLRYDRDTGRLESVLDLRIDVSGEVADIYLMPDLSFYLTDTDGSRVLHYDLNGRLMQVYRNHLNMARPVALVVLDNQDLVVADGHYDHLLHFNRAGDLIAVYGGRGEGAAEFLNIMTMASGPDGYYVGSRVGRRVQVIAEDGTYRYALDEGKVVFPAAIVVDRNNRSYVADQMDGQIKVFDRGRMIAIIGGVGIGPGQFKRIEDLWLDETYLYIVDSLNGRIHLARLLPEPVLAPEPVAPVTP